MIVISLKFMICVMGGHCYHSPRAPEATAPPFSNWSYLSLSVSHSTWLRPSELDKRDLITCCGNALFAKSYEVMPGKQCRYEGRNNYVRVL